MKNNVSGSGDSIFKKKGFFVALYSCMGAVIVLALVVSFTNLTTGPGSETAKEPDSQNELASVNASMDESYLSKAEEDDLAWKKPTPTPTPTTAPKATLKPSSPSVTAAPKKVNPTETTAPVIPIPAGSGQPNATQENSPANPSAAPAPETGEAITETEQQQADATETDVTQADTVQADAAAAETEKEMAFTPFSEDDKMIWPVYGDIAMVFSMDKLVYDPTLDQYRTNDDLRISAQEGTPVKASADGQVLEIGTSQTYGNYVSIDHGDGWVATYGQLMDTVLVAEGEVVKTGQVIGGVGKPSSYGSLNGTHMNLRVTKEDAPVDPRELLVDGQ